MIHCKVKIAGKVQGVYFRDHTKKKAKELGLKGWCRNEPDGTVYAEVEGTPESIDAFTQWAHQGPELAHVEQVQTSEGPVLGFEDFVIRR